MNLKTLNAQVFATLKGTFFVVEVVEITSLERVEISTCYIMCKDARSGQRLSIFTIFFSAYFYKYSHDFAKRIII